ncbi:MAG: RNA polymerase sigma factor [Crocinitomicaceae bacterium]
MAISTFKTHTNEALVIACLENNRQAQQELYYRFVGMMKGVCMRYAKDEMEAEDILQEAFIHAFKQLEKYEQKGSLGGWLRRLTVNKALEFCRKNASFQKAKDGLGILQSESTQVDDTIFQQIGLDALVAKIQLLPAGYRTVFNLYAVEGFKHKEIAEKMGISVGTSKSQYSQARQQLADMIQQEQEEELKRMAYAKR